MKIVLWKSHVTGEWWWHAMGRNGKLVVESPSGYARRATLERVISDVLWVKIPAEAWKPVPEGKRDALEIFSTNEAYVCELA